MTSTPISQPSAPQASPSLNAKTQLGGDDQFLDDLSAASRMKSFLVGRGIEVSSEISAGISTLLSKFYRDTQNYEEKMRKQDRERRFWKRNSQSKSAAQHVVSEGSAIPIEPTQS